MAFNFVFFGKQVLVARMPVRRKPAACHEKAAVKPGVKSKGLKDVVVVKQILSTIIGTEPLFFSYSTDKLSTPDKDCEGEASERP